MVLCENTCNSTLDKNMESTTEALNAGPEDFLAHKVSVFIYLYFTVPIAVWGWIGNCLSFRYVHYSVFFKIHFRPINPKWFHSFHTDPLMVTNTDTTINYIVVTPKL